MSENGSYLVLARKYRPETFTDLYGQEPMVQTLTNAFELGRISQAYMLTGVRGVGKTTTARILARALNYEKAGIDKPTVDMPDYGEHCEAIIQSRHIDVIEMDAASNTGIGDIREIIDAVKYKPASARYKVYIIDEVHMLSKAAFNGLLKTLEEPPEHVKFIFATTEIRKVPVTVLSRCQRFDLRRFDAATMQEYLKTICVKESVSVADDALALIARASEGSARDALSLLDQALAHGAENVSEEQVRDMLGLADRARIIDLFQHVMSGDITAALAEAKAQFDVGAEPVTLLSDLADFVHLVTTTKVTNNGVEGQALSEIERKKAAEFADSLSVRVLSRAWQLLLSGLKDVQQSPRPMMAADMVLVRLAYMADLPTPDEALRLLKEGKLPTGSSSTSTTASPSSGGSSAFAPAQPQAVGQTVPAGQPILSSAPTALAQPTPRPVLVSENPAPQPIETPKPAPEVLRIARFDDLVAIAGEKRSVGIKAGLENHVHLVSFEDGRLEFSPTDDMPPTFVRDLKTKLKEWTHAEWQVVISNEAGAATLAQVRAEEKEQEREDAENDPTVMAIKKMFPGSRIENITINADALPEGMDGLEQSPDDAEADDEE